MTSIKCNSAQAHSVDYVELGTIAWLKTIDNKVIQAKCSGVLDGYPYQKTDVHDIRHLWESEELKGLYWSDFTSRIIDLGILYKDEESARNGSGDFNAPVQQGELVGNVTLDVQKYLMEKYNLIKDNFKYVGDHLIVFVYRVNIDKETIDYVPCDIQFSVGHKGVELDLITIKYSNGHCFATREQAQECLDKNALKHLVGVIQEKMEREKMNVANVENFINSMKKQDNEQVKEQLKVKTSFLDGLKHFFGF